MVGGPRRMANGGAEVRDPSLKLLDAVVRFRLFNAIVIEDRRDWILIKLVCA